jgi:hypothetical protein
VLAGFLPDDAAMVPRELNRRIGRCPLGVGGLMGNCFAGGSCDCLLQIGLLRDHVWLSFVVFLKLFFVLAGFLPDAAAMAMLQLNCV